MAVDYTVLKAALLAETDPTFVTHRDNGDTTRMAEWLNGDSAFIVWKTRLTVKEMASAYVWTEMDSFTNAAKQYQFTLMREAGEINPADANVRSGLNEIFAGGGLATTRANLVALCKRAATRGEKVFATGTGTDGSPGTLTFEGALSSTDVANALYNT
jgi:hypothetical protein